MLNLSTTAGPDEIKTAYYGLAKKYHPDVIDAEENEEVKEKMANKFKLATEAYDILSDDQKRGRYN